MEHAVGAGGLKELRRGDELAGSVKIAKVEVEGTKAGQAGSPEATPHERVKSSASRRTGIDNSWAAPIFEKEVRRKGASFPTN